MDDKYTDHNNIGMMIIIMKWDKICMLVHIVNIEVTSGHYEKWVKKWVKFCQILSFINMLDSFDKINF